MRANQKSVSVNLDALRRKVEKILDIADLDELERAGKLVEQVAQRRVLDAVQAKTRKLRDRKLAGPWVMDREGRWARFRVGVGDIVSVVSKRSECRDADAALRDAGWELE